MQQCVIPNSVCVRHVKRIRKVCRKSTPVMTSERTAEIQPVLVACSKGERFIATSLAARHQSAVIADGPLR
jgi:hypothetical protein